MLEVAKIKVSNNLQGVFNLTLEGEYASYFEVQGTTLFMIKPIEDIGTYAITVVVEDPLGRFDMLRADYVFNIGCCPISTRPTTTTPAPASAPTAPAPLPTEDGPEDLSTARILGIMEGLPDVQRYAMRRDTNRNTEYYESPNYKLSSNNVWTSVRNYDSIFTYPDGTTFIREGRTTGSNSYVSPDGIMHNISSSLFITDFASSRSQAAFENKKMDYPGLFNGMMFNTNSNFLYYIDPSTGYSGPEDLISLGSYRDDISGFVKEILSPSDASLINVNATGRSRSQLFQRMFNENSSTNVFRLRSYHNLVYGQYRNIANSRALNGLLSRVVYVDDYYEERNWGKYIAGIPLEYPSSRNYYNRRSDVHRIIEYYGLLYGLENLSLDNRYRESYLYADDTRFDIEKNGVGFKINFYREKFHIVAVLYEIPKALYDRERSSRRYSIFPQLIVHEQQYNASTGTTKTVNPNANFSGRGVSAQVTRPTIDSVRIRQAGSPFNELVSPGNIALIAYYRIDDELAKYEASFFPNTLGPVRDRPQEEQNLVLEARLFNGDWNESMRLDGSNVLDRRFAESFVYSELCGATGYNSVDTVTAPTPSTTTEPPVVDDVEEVPEEEIEVFKMGNLNIDN